MDRGLAVILTACAGGLIALQAPINAGLGKATGSLPAALVSFLVGTVALAATAGSDVGATCGGGASCTRISLSRPRGTKLGRITTATAISPRTRNSASTHGHREGVGS